MESSFYISVGLGMENQNNKENASQNPDAGLWWGTTENNTFGLIFQRITPDLE